MPFLSSRSFFLWPLTSGLLLIFACFHPLWAHYAARRTGDFCSHTLYQGFMGFAAVALLGHGLRSGQKKVLWWPLAVSLLSALCVEGLKRATHLPRPDGEPTGFPSGHTTFVFALAWLLTQIFPRFAPFLVWHCSERRLGAGGRPRAFSVSGLFWCRVRNNDRLRCQFWREPMDASDSEASETENA